MATKEAAVGMAHPTAIPENFERDSESTSRSSAESEREVDASDGRDSRTGERSSC